MLDLLVQNWERPHKVMELRPHFLIVSMMLRWDKNSSLKKLLSSNHTEANRGVIREHLTLEYIFGFCRSFIEIAKGLRLELEIKTSNRKHNILYTTLRDNAFNLEIKFVNL